VTTNRIHTGPTLVTCWTCGKEGRYDDSTAKAPKGWLYAEAFRPWAPLLPVVVCSSKCRNALNWERA
jgi:hypothetical protein